MPELSEEHTFTGDEANREGKWSLAEGAVLGGYRVVKPIGRGGMGEVYLVENVQTGVRFALKLLPPGLSGDAAFRERFGREAGLPLGDHVLERPVPVRGATRAHSARRAAGPLPGASLRGEA